jgi:hypothetical protein
MPGDVGGELGSAEIPGDVTLPVGLGEAEIAQRTRQTIGCVLANEDERPAAVMDFHCSPFIGRQ